MRMVLSCAYLYVDEAGRMLRRRDIVDVDLQETMEPTAGDINLETMDMPLRECGLAQIFTKALQ